MTNSKTDRPDCFGDLNTVFPMGDSGLRQSPDNCMICKDKTDCLRRALASEAGAEVDQGGVTRSNPSGRLFKGLRRWSHLKAARSRSRSGK